MNMQKGLNNMLDQAVEASTATMKDFIDIGMSPDEAKKYADRYIKTKSHHQVEYLFKDANAGSFAKKVADIGKAVFIS